MMYTYELPLNTTVLTPFGFVEAWSILEDSELMDKKGYVFKVISSFEKEEEVVDIELETENFKVGSSYFENTNLTLGSDVILKEPVPFSGILFDDIVSVKDGEGFGTFGAYSFIPYRYLYSGTEERKRFFQGLLFSQSLEEKIGNQVTFLVKDDTLAGDLAFLIMSLGGVATINYFYDETDFYELLVDLPAYFKEGVPSRKILKVNKVKKKEELVVIKTNQSNLIIKDFIVIPGYEER